MVFSIELDMEMIGTEREDEPGRGHSLEQEGIIAVARVAVITFGIEVEGRHEKGSCRSVAPFRPNRKMMPSGMIGHFPRSKPHRQATAGKVVQPA